MFGFGIIGTGNIAKLHADCIDKIPNARLLGVLTKSEFRAREITGNFNAPVFWEMEKLLSHPEIDVICVCNESGLHGTTIAKIAKANKHILCEKPLETSVEKIDAIAEIIKIHRVKLACVFQNRENPEYKKLKNHIESGSLGKILLCQTSINWFRPPSYYQDSWRGTLELDGGAALINQGIHTIDLMLDLMGEVDMVSGLVGTLHHQIEGEDVAVANLKFKSGALGTLSCGTAFFPGEPESITLYGTLGNIVFSGGKIVSSTVNSIHSTLGASDQNQGSGASDPMAITDQFHIAVIIDIMDAVRNNRAPKVNIEEAKKSVALINAIYQSKGNAV
ncbi:MAG: Gfo/Idh/MocA family oxidoreductase [Flavobacteriaceae bacterium]|jgi:UDP-N-acetyl-2-amino-2-deoxyglucuronate dehydrogenase